MKKTKKASRELSVVMGTSIPYNIAKKLVSLAQDRGTTNSALIRVAIVEYVKEHEQPPENNRMVECASCHAKYSNKLNSCPQCAMNDLIKEEKEKRWESKKSAYVRKKKELLLSIDQKKDSIKRYNRIINRTQHSHGDPTSIERLRIELHDYERDLENLNKELDEHEKKNSMFT